MKILQHGHIPDPPKKTRRFKCVNCGCVFEADRSEYNCAGPWGVVQHHGRIVALPNEYFCPCPECTGIGREITPKGDRPNVPDPLQHL